MTVIRRAAFGPQLGMLILIVILLASGTALSAAAGTGPPAVRNAAPARAAAARSGVPDCQVGAYVTKVYDITPPGSTFSARFWVWSLCREKAWDPLPGLSFPGATHLTISNGQYSHELGDYRHAELLQGQFYQGIDEASYPFDRKTLDIEITPAPSVSHLTLTADGQDSMISPDMEIPGWKVIGYHVDVGPERFVGNLGNRTTPAAAGHVKSTMLIDTEIARSDPVGFLQMVFPLWVIFLVAVVTFLRIDTDPERIGSRGPLLAGLMLAIILNMQLANTIVYSEGVSMIVQLHILTMAMVLGALVVNTYHWRWSVVAGEDAARAQLRIERHRRINLGVGVGVYMAATALIMWHAAATG